MLKSIGSLERWNEFIDELAGYRIWQMQYDVDHPAGFHAWFCAHGKPDVEIITRNKSVYNAIIKFITGK